MSHFNFHSFTFTRLFSHYNEVVMITLAGRKQDEMRARMMTRLTPMAENQIDDTSYKSVEMNKLKRDNT